MKQLAIAVLLPFIATAAVAEEKTEGRRLAELTFESVDTSGRGFVDMGQMEAQRDLIFISMDANDDGRLTEEELTSWDYGFANIAEEQDKVLAYTTALRVVFDFWDRDGDGAITQTEHRKAIFADFERADINSDAVLDQDEFLNGFGIIVALRAALKPTA